MPLQPSNRALILTSRPKERCSMENFKLIDIPLQPLKAGEIRIQTAYLSVDPTNRIWMSELPGYMPPVALGEIMRAVGLGRVIESNPTDFKVGDYASGLLGWQEVVTIQASHVNKIDPIEGVPLSLSLPLFLGPLGLTGLTAYFGLKHIGKPKPGETVVVSAAAGAVGSIAAQLARIAGARVVGIAGSDEKCTWLKEVAGLDATINYRKANTPDSFHAALHAACPKGIDVYFENVGGETLEAVLSQINLGARIPLCGLISQYNEAGPVRGPGNFEQILMKRAVVQGFIILDFAAEFAAAVRELAPLVLSGKIKHQESIIKGGLEVMVDAVNMLFDGKNNGKLIVDLRN
jgi:NADPH-dependent curcumin reductase CurA